MIMWIYGFKKNASSITYTIAEIDTYSYMELGGGGLPTPLGHKK